MDNDHIIIVLDNIKTNFMNYNQWKTILTSF